MSEEKLWCECMLGLSIGMLSSPRFSLAIGATEPQAASVIHVQLSTLQSFSFPIAEGRRLVAQVLRSSH